MLMSSVPSLAQPRDFNGKALSPKEDGSLGDLIRRRGSMRVKDSEI
jgi:hypothetical protein